MPTAHPLFRLAVFASLAALAHAATASAPASVIGRTQIAASLHSAETAAQIRSAEQGERATLYAQIDAGIETARQGLLALRRTCDDHTGDAHDRFLTACDRVRAHEQVLRESLRAARAALASSGTVSGSLPTRLAADYEAYAQAVAVAEAAAASDVSASALAAR